MPRHGNKDVRDQRGPRNSRSGYGLRACARNGPGRRNGSRQADRDRMRPPHIIPHAEGRAVLRTHVGRSGRPGPWHGPHPRAAALDQGTRRCGRRRHDHRIPQSPRVQRHQMHRWGRHRVHKGAGGRDRGRVPCWPRYRRMAGYRYADTCGRGGRGVYRLRRIEGRCRSHQKRGHQGCAGLRERMLLRHIPYAPREAQRLDHRHQRGVRHEAPRPPERTDGGQPAGAPGDRQRDEGRYRHRP